MKSSVSRAARIPLSILKWAGRTLLTVVAVFGAIAVLAVPVGWYYDAEIQLFTTGSMEPTIPTGAAAASVPIANEDIEVGDILTFKHGRNEIPTTHRVIDINDPEAIDDVLENQRDYWQWEGENDWLSNLTRGHYGESTLIQQYEIVEPSVIDDGTVVVVEMQGDANSVPDARPYLVTDDNAFEVLGHIPAVAPFLQLLQKHAIWLFGALLIVLAWMMYPRDSKEVKKAAKAEKAAKKEAAERGDADADIEQSSSDIKNSSSS